MSMLDPDFVIRLLTGDKELHKKLLRHNVYTRLASAGYYNLLEEKYGSIDAIIEEVERRESEIYKGALYTKILDIMVKECKAERKEQRKVEEETRRIEEKKRENYMIENGLKYQYISASILYCIQKIENRKIYIDYGISEDSSTFERRGFNWHSYNLRANLFAIDENGNNKRIFDCGIISSIEDREYRRPYGGVDSWEYERSLGKTMAQLEQERQERSFAEIRGREMIKAELFNNAYKGRLNFTELNKVLNSYNYFDNQSLKEFMNRVEEEFEEIAKEMPRNDLKAKLDAKRLQSTYEQFLEKSKKKVRTK